MVHRQPLIMVRVDGIDFEVLNPSISDFQVCPVKLPSILRCIYQNCCLFLVSRLCGDVIAI
jgi:hypothetical protein